MSEAATLLNEEMAAAAAAIVDVVLSNRRLRQLIATEELRKLVARGDFLPREALQIGNTYELVPVGRMASLEEMCRAVVSAADGDGAPDRVLIAIREMEQVLDGVAELFPTLTIPDDPAELSPEPDPEPEPETPKPKSKAKSSSVESEPPPPGPCAVCGRDVNAEQALISWTRWRHVLCLICHQAGWPPPREVPDGNG